MPATPVTSEAGYPGVATADSCSGPCLGPFVFAVLSQGLGIVYNIEFRKKGAEEGVKKGSIRVL